jgi:hypothetical protein
VIYRLLADLVSIVHLAFIVFVVLGGLLVVRRPRVAWLHVPAVVWGACIEFLNAPCPLTPLEQQFRRLGGQAGYDGGFIEHYVTAIIYPDGLTRGMQITFGALVVLINLVVYSRAWRRRTAI